MRTHIPIDNPPLGHGQRAPRAGCHWDPGSPPSRVPAFLLARSKINLLRHAIALPAGVEDDGWAGRGLVAVVQVCAAQCSHSLFYSDRVACAGALRVRGLIMISHGSNSLVVYIPTMVAMHVPALAQKIRRVFAMGRTPGTLSSALWPWALLWHASRMRPRSHRRMSASTNVGCCVASFANVGGCVASFAKPRMSAAAWPWFDVVQGGRQGPLAVVGSSHRENCSLPGRK
jgi:hypothetical protein